VPRKKKILFQTPLVPSILVQPALTQGDYPAQRTSSDVSADTDLLNVSTDWIKNNTHLALATGTPQEAAVDAALAAVAPVAREDVLEIDSGTNPDGTYVPKNFYHIVPKSLIRKADLFSQTETPSTLGACYGTNSSFDTLSFKVLGAVGSPVFIGRGYLETSLFTSISSADDTGVTFTYNTGVDILTADGVSVNISKRLRGASSWDSPYYTEAPYDTNTSPTATIGASPDNYDTHDFLINIGFES